MAAKKKAVTRPPAETQDLVREPQRKDILVKATQDGYYNLKRFREGDTFFLNAEEDFSTRWMVAVGPDREEIEEETDRLGKIAELARRKALAEKAENEATPEPAKVKSSEELAAELEKAKSAPSARPSGRSKGAVVPDSGDPKRKLAGSDFETHEDVRPEDAQSGPNGRASDKPVV